MKITIEAQGDQKPLMRIEGNEADTAFTALMVLQRSVLTLLESLKYTLIENEEDLEQAKENLINVAPAIRRIGD